MSGIPLRHLVSEIDERTGNSGPLLSVSIHSGVYRRDDVNRDAPRADTLENYKRCRSGDLVLNRMRAFQGALGVAPVDGIVSPDYAVLRASPGIDMRFVAYALRSAWGVAEMVSRLRGIGGVSSGVVRTPRINVSDLLEIRLRPLDRPAQTAVADMLDRECQRIAALRSAISRHSSQLDALRSACVREATATLHQVPLKYCASVIDCKHRTAAYLDRGFPLISTREVTRGALHVDQETRRVGPADFADLRDGGRDPRRSDIIYSRNASVGVAAYLSTDLEVCMGQDVVLITRRPRDCELLNYVLNWGVVDQVESLSIGSTFSRINVATIRQLVVPSDSPQREAEALAVVHREFRRLGSLDQTARAFGSRLDEYRDALIVEAVTGQLAVTGVSDAQLDEHAHAAAEGVVAGDRPPARVG